MPFRGDLKFTKSSKVTKRRGPLDFFYCSVNIAYAFNMSH